MDNGVLVTGDCDICGRALYVRRVGDMVRCAGCGERRDACMCPEARAMA